MSKDNSHNKSHGEDLDYVFKCHLTMINGNADDANCEAVKSKFFEEQRELYEKLQNDASKNASSDDSPPLYTITQWIREGNKRQRTSEMFGHEMQDNYVRENSQKHSHPTTTKTPTKTFECVPPVTLEKDIQVENVNLNKDTQIEVAPDPIRCSTCQYPMDQCHEVLFSSYCMKAVDRQFRATPLAMSRNRCNRVFTAAYNKSRDFHLFTINRELPPHGYYYTPACLKDRLREVIHDIESEQEDHISGKQGLRIREVVNSPHIEEPTQIINPDEEITQGVSEDIAIDLDGDSNEALCKYCEKIESECHKVLFSEYCFLHVQRQYDLFPTAMNPAAALKHYMTVYNEALHFYSFQQTSIFPEYSFHKPPRCLEKEMCRGAAHIGRMHKDYIREHEQFDDVMEPIENNMDFDGLYIHD